MNDTIAQAEGEIPPDQEMVQAIATVKAAGVRNCYLAAPLSSPDITLQAHRAFATSRVAGLMMDQDIVVYSPLSHGWLLQQFNGERSHDWWMEHCMPMLDRFSYLLILTLPGYRESKGVMMEIEHAKDTGIPIRWLAPSPALIADFNLEPRS